MSDEPDWQDYEDINTDMNWNNIEVPVRFYCPVCKCDVPKEDAFVVVYSCRMNKLDNTLTEVPGRAFHFNPFKNIICRGDLKIYPEKEKKL